MICQHCGWDSFVRKDEEDECPMCGECYAIPGNPAVIRTGHRMPWMMYTLALRDRAAAFDEVLTSEEMAIIEAADLANSLPIDLHPDGFDKDLRTLTTEELLLGLNKLRVRLLFCDWLRAQGVWAITNPDDLRQPTVMDAITGTMKWYQPKWAVAANSTVWQN